MTVAGINIAFLADVTSFLRGVQSTEDALDDVADALDDVAKDAQDAGTEAGRGLERGVERGAEDAADSVTTLERSFRELAQDVSKHTRAAGDDLGDNIKRGTKEAQRGLKDAEGGLEDFKSESASTARETAASFDGSADSIAGAFQEASANAFAGFGPAAGVAGLAAAAGIGALWSSIHENAEASKQTISDMYNDFLESGAEFLSKEAIAARIGELYDVAADKATTKRRELIQSLSDSTDIGEPLLARAIVGDEDARAMVSAEIARKRVEITSAMDEAFGKGLSTGQYADALLKLNEVEAALKDTATAADTARRNADAATAAISGITAPTQGAARSAEDARAKFNGLGQEIAKLPPVKVTVDMSEAETKVRDFLNRPRRLVVGVSATPGAPQAV